MSRPVAPYDHHGHPTYYRTAYPAGHRGAYGYAAGQHGVNAYNSAGYYNGGHVQQGHPQQVVGHGTASYYGGGHGQQGARGQDGGTAASRITVAGTMTTIMTTDQR